MPVTQVRYYIGRVYGPGRARVKPCLAGVWAAALPALTTGCGASLRGPAATPYPLAVSYNAELLGAMDGPTAAATVRDDLACIRKLGFDTVLAGHCIDGHEALIARAARREGLEFGWARPEVLYYVRTGRLPEDCRSVAALVAGLGRSQPGGLAVLGAVVDAPTAARSKEVARACRKLSPAPTTLVTVTGSEADPGSVRPEVTLVACSAEVAEAADGGVVVVDCGRHLDEPGPQASARWLRDYHAGLAAGLTGGLIFRPFRVVPGQWRGLVEGTDRGGLDRATTIRRITGRAAHWGPRLRRLSPCDIRPLGPVSPELRAVLFSGEKRRFVMLCNTSVRHFVRGIVDLPDELDSRSVLRAVPVPPDPSRFAGEVIRPRTGRLSMTVELAPGEAALWELF